MKKILISIMVFGLIVINVPMAFSQPAPTEGDDVVASESDLQQCKTSLAVSQVEVAALHSKIPGKGIVWKLSHFGTLDSNAKTAVIIEVVTYIALITVSVAQTTQ